MSALNGKKKVVKKKKKKAIEPPRVESMSRYTNFDDYERKLISSVYRSDWVTVHVRFRLSIRDEESYARAAAKHASLLTAAQYGYHSSAVVPTAKPTAGGAGGAIRPPEQPCDFKIRLPLSTPLSTIGRKIAERHGPLASLILTRKPTDNQPLALHLTLRDLEFDTTAAAAAAATANASTGNGSLAIGISGVGGGPSSLGGGAAAGGPGGGLSAAGAAVLNRLDAEREIWFDYEPAFALQSPLLLTDPCLYTPPTNTPSTAAPPTANASTAATSASANAATAPTVTAITTNTAAATASVPSATPRGMAAAAGAAAAAAALSPRKSTAIGLGTTPLSAIKAGGSDHKSLT